MLPYGTHNNASAWAHPQCCRAGATVSNARRAQVGVSAAARIKKSCLCLCTNGVSVDQWKYQFEMWTNIQVGWGGV